MSAVEMKPPAVAATVPPPLGKLPRTALQRRQARLAWLLLMPTMLVVLIVAAYPLARTFYLSFTNFAFGQPSHFIGWTNYYNLINDAKFRESVLETFKFAVITVPCEFVLGLGIALVVNSRFKGRGGLRAAMLVPWAIITVINAEMWSLMYNSSYGVFNDILVRIHWPGAPFAFLSGDPNLALFSACAIDIWKTTPFVALILLAGLQVISPELYEATAVDGANKIRQFWAITLPLLRPAILVALIFRTMDALRVFDLFYVLFGLAPCFPGNCRITMAVYAQEYLVSFAAGTNGPVGYGSAISVAIFLILAIVIVIYVKVLPLEKA